ncbi:MAG: MBL fold metallo-hydrolase [Treponema sp.]|nr:MBL fold metallo-hydrolase [Treponema sp.]
MNISVLNTGPFGINTWIIELCKNKALVFDPAACRFTRDSQKIIDFLKEKNLEPVAFLLTHGHFDHITGTGICKSFYPEVPLLIHNEDSVMIGKNAAEVQKFQLESMGLEKLLPALEGLPDADVAFSGEPVLSSIIKTDDLELNNALSDWKILHTPGHTKGSVCYYNEKEKILVTGDTIFYHSWGRTDFPGGSESEMMKSLERIYSTLPQDVQVFPGHEYAGFLLTENR